MSKQVQIKRQDIPSDWTLEAADFINRCLQRKPANRLGLKGISEAKDHPWFKNYPWKDLYEKKIDSPFFPKTNDNFDRRYCEQQEKIGMETNERYQAYMQDEEFPNVFRKFTYVNFDELLEKKEKKTERKEFNKSASMIQSTSPVNQGLMQKIKPSSQIIVDDPQSQFRSSSTNKNCLAPQSNVLIPTKTIRGKIKMNEGGGFEQKSAILQNNINLDLTKNVFPQSQQKKMDLTSSIIFEDKLKGVKNGLRESNSNINISIMNSTRMNMNNFNNINNVNYDQTNKVNFGGVGIQKEKTNIVVTPNSSKLPDIESKLEKIKKLGSTQNYTSRGVSALSNNSSIVNKDNSLLSGIMKKITPTKIVSSSNISNNNINTKKILYGNSTSKLSNYSTINSKRDVSPLQYLTNKEGK